MPVNNKALFIQASILDEHANMTCITETWLEDIRGVSMSECPTGYKVKAAGREQGSQPTQISHFCSCILKTYAMQNNNTD